MPKRERNLESVREWERKRQREKPHWSRIACLTIKSELQFHSLFLLQHQKKRKFWYFFLSVVFCSLFFSYTTSASHCPRGRFPFVFRSQIILLFFSKTNFPSIFSDFHLLLPFLQSQRDFLFSFFLSWTNWFSFSFHAVLFAEQTSNGSS